MLTVNARKQTAECAPIMRMQPPAAVRSLERGQTAQPGLAAKPKAPFLQLERAATQFLDTTHKRKAQGVGAMYFQKAQVL